MQGHPLIGIGADRPLFCVVQSGSFTIPDSIAVTSPTAQYQPAAVAGTFNDVRPGVGGQVLLTLSDAGSGIVAPVAAEIELFPGDVITASAVVSNVVTFSRTSPGGTAQVIAQATGVTAFAALIGVYG